MRQRRPEVRTAPSGSSLRASTSDAAKDSQKTPKSSTFAPNLHPFSQRDRRSVSLVQRKLTLFGPFLSALLLFPRAPYNKPSNNGPVMRGIQVTRCAVIE